MRQFNAVSFLHYSSFAAPLSIITFIKKLSNDLKEYGNSYSARNLEFMSQFANSFSLDEFTKQPVSEIPWGTIITIMQKSNSHEELLYYINETHKNNHL